MAGFDVGLHIAQVGWQAGETVHVQRCVRVITEAGRVGPEHGREVGPGREQPGPLPGIDGVLRPQPRQFAPDQRQRGALLRTQGAGVDLFCLRQQMPCIGVAALVVGGRFTEQHRIVQRLAGEHGRQGQLMALEGPVAFGQRRQCLRCDLPGLFVHGPWSLGVPQIASRITAIVQSGIS